MKEIGKIIDLPLETTSTGDFVSIDDKKQQIPFRVKRAYWIYGVPQGENRGGHAHKQLRQVIIAAKGSFTVNLDDGHEKKQYHLTRPDQGLFLDTEIWRTLDNFSPGAVCLVLASEPYDADDYLYEYEKFLDYISSRKR